MQSSKSFDQRFVSNSTTGEALRKRKKQSTPGACQQAKAKSSVHQGAITAREPASLITAKEFRRKKKKPNFVVQDLEPSALKVSDAPSESTTDMRRKLEPKIVPLRTPGFCWDADAKLFAEVIEQAHASDSSEDEDESISKKKKKRQTVAEKREAAKKEEERLRTIEETLASNTNLPSSCDEFDRALLSNPDSSELWLQYMAFHLQVCTKAYIPNLIGQVSGTDMPFQVHFCTCKFIYHP